MGVYPKGITQDSPGLSRSDYPGLPIVATHLPRRGCVIAIARDENHIAVGRIAADTQLPIGCAVLRSLVPHHPAPQDRPTDHLTLSSPLAPNPSCSFIPLFSPFVLLSLHYKHNEYSTSQSRSASHYLGVRCCVEMFIRVQLCSVFSSSLVDSRPQTPLD